MYGELNKEDLFRELGCRSHAGITVTLFWEVGTENTLVEVVDKKYRTYDVLDVPEPSMTIEVFTHPFAYLNALRRANNGK